MRVLAVAGVVLGAVGAVLVREALVLVGERWVGRRSFTGKWAGWRSKGGKLMKMGCFSSMGPPKRGVKH